MNLSVGNDFLPYKCILAVLDCIFLLQIISKISFSKKAILIIVIIHSLSQCERNSFEYLNSKLYPAKDVQGSTVVFGWSDATISSGLLKPVEKKNPLGEEIQRKKVGKKPNAP